MSATGAVRGAPGEAELPGECARLAGTLRELRAATGLSLARLAELTPYSKSSWERYLNGKTLPPRQAVAQLCALAGETSRQPLALWELAESVWSGRAGTPPRGAEARRPAPPPPPDEGYGTAPASSPDDGHRARPPYGDGPVRGAFGAGAARRTGPGVAAVAGLGALTAVLVLVTWYGTTRGGGTGAPTTAPAATIPATTAPGRSTPGCHAGSCTGKDAEDQRCSSGALPPVTLAEHRFSHGTVVRLRRSVACETVWARIDRGRKGDRVEISVPGVPPRWAEVRDRFDEAASLSAPMVAAYDEDLAGARACLVRGGVQECFGT